MERLKKKVSAMSAKEDLPAGAAEYKKGLTKWLPMIVLSLALMIIIIDTTVLNVSLKTIVNDLGTNIQGIQWVITAYALTLAALTITGGRLGDLYGRRKMFMYGAVIFAIGSFITSISHSVGMMIVGESVVEGVGAALMMPATASLIVANYKGKDRAIAFGIWGGVAGAASALGPILGGYLTTNYSWRWAFRINIFVAIALLLGAVLIGESREHLKKSKLDVVGVILSAAGLLAFVFGIIESSSFGWMKALQPYALFGHDFAPLSLSIAPIAMVVGIILLALFAWWEKYVESRGKVPLVSLHMFKNKQFMSGSMVVALLSLGMVGLIFALPVFLQSVQNLDALHTGLALLPLSIMVLIAAPASAFLTKFITTKRLIQVGLLIAVAGSVVLHYAITPDATSATLAPGLMLFGLGIGFVMAQASNITLSAVSVEESGEASGINNTLRQVGSSFGSAIIGAVLLASLASNLTSGVTNSPVIPDALKPTLSQAVSAQASNVELGGAQSDTQAAQLPHDVQTELGSIANQASAKASSTAILVTGIFVVLSFFASCLLPNTKHFDKSTTPTAAH